MIIYDVFTFDSVGTYVLDLELYNVKVKKDFGPLSEGDMYDVVRISVVDGTMTCKKDDEIWEEFAIGICAIDE